MTNSPRRQAIHALADSRRRAKSLSRRIATATARLDYLDPDPHEHEVAALVIDRAIADLLAWASADDEAGL